MSRRSSPRKVYGRLDKNSMTEYQVEEIDKFREHVGLPELVCVKRNCLRCDREFSSFGRGNRMCDSCRALRSAFLETVHLGGS